MHRCQWKNCGAPATKKLRIRLKNPFYKQLQRDGTITTEKAEGRDLWRCDEHYADAIEHWGDSDVFIVEP